MITLYNFGPFQGLADPSPFCLVAEMIVPESQCELNEIALSFNNLVSFVKRMKIWFYPE